MEIKKIKPLSLAKISAFFGFLTGILFGISTIISANALGIKLSFSEALNLISQNPSLGAAPLFFAIGWLSLLISPLIFAFWYFVLGIIFSFIYNFFAKFFGGLKIEVIEESKNKTK
ncbi:MAG: DUF3566 domain-containing protein [Candidatus Pacearchaeota archaeon]